MEEHIRANAEMVVQELRPLSGIDFGYTPESVEWLEEYIERLRNSGEFENVETKDRLTSVFGSFLGECIVRNYGGEWTQHDGAWCVVFSEGDMAFPFAKAAKQFESGPVDGISSFFRVIPVLFEGRVRSLSSTPKKPWWKVW